MTAIGLELTLTAPALLSGAPPASNLIESLSFVPGNTVRGVLARRYLDLGGDPGAEEFRRLFLDGQVRFGFGFLDGAEVVPLSARSCKYDPGFAGPGHGVLDSLLGLGEDRCPVCQRTLDSFSSYWIPENPGREIEVSTRLITRTAIDPQRGTARSGQLFSQRVLSEGQRFLSKVELPDDLLPAVERLIAEPFSGSIGTGSSRGQGWVEVRRAEKVDVEQSAARERYEGYRARAKRPVLALTLQSDALFQDDYLREATAPRLEDLEPHIRPSDWKPRPDAYLDVRRVFGFDGFPIRLPRPNRLAVVAGSVFLFEAREGATPEIPEGNGEIWIGDRNGEGYGRAVLWHPFHLDLGGVAS